MTPQCLSSLVLVVVLYASFGVSMPKGERVSNFLFGFS